MGAVDRCFIPHLLKSRMLISIFANKSVHIIVHIYIGNISPTLCRCIMTAWRAGNQLFVRSDRKFNTREVNRSSTVQWHQIDL